MIYNNIYNIRLRLSQYLFCLRFYRRRIAAGSEQVQGAQGGGRHQMGFHIEGMVLGHGPESQAADRLVFERRSRRRHPGGIMAIYILYTPFFGIRVGGIENSTAGGKDGPRDYTIPRFIPPSPSSLQEYACAPSSLHQ